MFRFLLTHSYARYYLYGFWRRRGVDGPEPTFGFGYLLDKARNDPIEYEREMATKYGQKGYYGVFTGFLPTLTLLDPGMIKQVFVNKFARFANRRKLNSTDRLWNLNMYEFSVARTIALAPMDCDSINSTANHLIYIHTGSTKTKTFGMGFASSWHPSSSVAASSRCM